MRYRTGESEGAPAEKFYGQGLANRSNRRGTVLDFEERQQGHGHGAFYSARADGGRGLASPALCPVFWPSVTHGFRPARRILVWNDSPERGYGEKSFGGPCRG